MSRIFLFVFTLTCVSCNSEDYNLDEAHETHLEAMKTSKEVRADLIAMKSDTMQAAKADSLLEVLKAWEGGVAEVPGFAHVHWEGHQHSHVEVRDSEQLNQQKQSLAAIKELENSL